MAIYTRTGDSGETGLIGGRRVPKNHPIVCAIGELDELNSTIGVLMTFVNNSYIKRTLACIQRDIFLISAELANPDKKAKKNTTKPVIISSFHTKALEQEIDAIQKKLPRLKNFILPGGTVFAAHAHMARAICRRAERSICSLKRQNLQFRVYLNRLSDLLFTLARSDNFKHKRHGFY